MAGLEVVVRPVIFPDIRPRPKPSLPPQDDPTKGFAKITGNPAQAIGMSFSQSISSSHAKPIEIERRVDEVRVYQEMDDGTVNKENFVDIQVANRIKTIEPTPIERHLTGDRPVQGRDEEKTAYYKRYDEWEKEDIRRNIELKERDKVISDEKRKRAAAAAKGAGWDH